MDTTIWRRNRERKTYLIAYEFIFYFFFYRLPTRYYIFTYFARSCVNRIQHRNRSTSKDHVGNRSMRDFFPRFFSFFFFFFVHSTRSYAQIWKFDSSTVCVSRDSITICCDRPLKVIYTHNCITRLLSYQRFSHDRDYLLFGEIRWRNECKILKKRKF